MSEVRKEVLKSLQVLGYSADEAQEMTTKAISLYGEQLDARLLVKHALMVDNSRSSLSFEQHALAAFARIESQTRSR